MMMLLSVSMAALSCSKEPSRPMTDTYTIVVSGTASDKADGTPLENIRISLYTEESKISDNLQVSATTDERGYFTLKLGNFTRPVTCTITAEDVKGFYKMESQDINISWSGTSFDLYTGYFYVNDCDFYMERILELE